VPPSILFNAARRIRSRVFCLALCIALNCNAFAADTASVSPSSSPIVVGYFGQWGVYDHFFVKNLLTSGAAAQLDQINYSQGSVTGARCNIADANADLNLTFTADDSVNGIADNKASAFRGDLHQLAELKKQFPKLKILISLEGRASDFAIAAQPENRSAFVASCVDRFIRGHFAPGAEDANLFDGIDLDWEYPQAQDAANFIELLTQLREAMNEVRPGLRLSVAVGPSPRMYPGVNMTALSHIVDQVGIMNYDYTGPWNHTTGFLAPLHSSTGRSVESSILAYRDAGVPAHQMLMGIPFYGYGWEQVSSTGHGLFQPGQAIHGDRPYSLIETLASASHSDGPPPANAPSAANPNAATDHAATKAVPFTVYRDPESHAPWLYDGSTFWTYDDPISIRFKVGFATEQHLGGVMAWELSEDSADAALVKAVRFSFAQSHADEGQDSASLAHRSSTMTSRK
jgi:chitinase